jgi:peptide/nickel transport system substrate-binding protein
MVLAPVIMIVVIIVVGAGGYAALSAVSGSGSTTVSSCAPATSSVCKAATGGNNVNTFVPYSPAFGSTVLTVSAGSTLPVTVSVPGSSASSYTINWGDGSSTTQSSATITHSYADVGNYVISATADVGGVTHTGTGSLYPVGVSPSLETQSSGEFPTISATLTNGSTAATQFGWLKGSGTIAVSATYSAPPANPSFVPQTTSISSTGGTKGTSTATASGASASYTFSSAGVYEINFTGPIENTATSALVYQNYTWTVYVSPATLSPGCAQCRTSSSGSAKSPHAGSITDYEVVPAGGTSVDPAIDYETVGAEMVYNVYQTLITYNGTSTAGFIPQLATCVPGSAQCVAQYGQNLTYWNNTLGGVEWWTFVLDKNARFYDPSTHASWGVYPTDVEYSVARTLSYADLPGIESTAGWILAQALLPAGQLSYDVSSLTGVGIHQPFNNTPSNIFASMLVNDSAYCPSTAMTTENGCITFVADGPAAQNGYTAPRVWSNFLQFISDPLGGGVVPSGWYNAQGLGASIPGWPTTGAAHGDGPTLLPGNAMSSTDSTYLSAIAGIGPFAWDAMQEQMLVAYPSVNAQTRYNAVGSGPYYLVSFNPSVGYSLEANPAYAQPSGCVGQQWCEPAVGNYARNVTVYWESTDTAGIQQYIAGHTDFAGILTTDTPTLLSLVQQGKIGAFTVPTLNLFFFNYALTFDTVAAQALDPFTLNVPGTFFASDSVRNFLNLAYPYTTIENTINTVDGIVFGDNYGGSIPVGMGNYYPENITWPSADPTTNPAIVGSAGWWWAQMITSGSPYYDSYVANSCTTSSPCEFPIIGELGAPGLDAAIQLWIHEIYTISGGRLDPNTFDLSFGELYVTSVSSTPGQIPLPIYTLGWAPDYPDPTDYLPTLWTNGSYGLPDATYYTFSQAAYNSPDCGHLDDLGYWAAMPQIPADCQGVAFMTLDYWSGIASAEGAGPQRVLTYNLIEHIGAALSLTQYTFQQSGVGTYAPWVNPATIDTNVMWAGDALFYFLQGNGVQYAGST